MKIFDFVCVQHPEDIREARADSLKEVPKEDRTCSHCGELMERYFGRATPQVALLGANWPKRDIKETAHRNRRSKVLEQRQKKVWDPRQPKLNLDPDVQRSMKEELARKGSRLTVKKI